MKKKKILIQLHYSKAEERYMAILESKIRWEKQWRMYLFAYKNTPLKCVKLPLRIYSTSILTPNLLPHGHAIST